VAASRGFHGADAGVEGAGAAEELGSCGGAGDAGDAAGRELRQGGPEALPYLALVEAVHGAEDFPGGREENQGYAHGTDVDAQERMMCGHVVR